MNGDASIDALRALLDAFEHRDVGAALDCFADHPQATYAGSEAGEVAVGVVALRDLFTELFARDEQYRFDVIDVETTWHDDIGVVLAEVAGHEENASGVEDFDYRISGTLLQSAGTWRWLQVHGSEPTPVAFSDETP